MANSFTVNCFRSATCSTLRKTYDTLCKATCGDFSRTRLEPKKYSSLSSDSQNYNVVVVGGGIVGTATARELSLRYPHLRMAIVEKENTLAKHQSGRSSCVIHAGIYYKPGSLRAKLCVEGLKKTYEYCDAYNIPYKRCGKLIVALNEEENGRLKDIYERALQNDCPGIELVNAEQVREIEPNCRGVAAIWSPNTGIVDYKTINLSYGENFKNNGGNIYLNFKVIDLQEDSSVDPTNGYPIKVIGNTGELRCQYLITCGGLYADKLATLSGCDPEPKIVPFRGEYLLLKPEKTDMVHTNIYPVPNPRFPFLGVHFTPRMNGDVWLGPNAVLAAKREGYSFTDMDLKEFLESLSYRGLQKIALRNISAGVQELYGSLFMRAQVNKLRKYVPSLQLSDVIRGPSGVRAQALDRDGNLVEDFVFDSGASSMSKRVLHVRNAPSPAATSSQTIAEMVADTAAKTFKFVNV